MAKTIEYLTLMVDVTPYEHEGNNYDALNIIVAYRRGRGFCVTWQPVKREPMGYMTGPMPSSDPLVGGKGFVVKTAPRNNSRTLIQMRTNLEIAQEGIKFFFDQRNYDALKEFMGDVANYGYSYNAEKQLKETVKNYNDMKLNLAKNVKETKSVQTAQVNNPAIEDVAFEMVESQEAKKSEVRSKKSEVRGKNSRFSVVTYKTKKGTEAPQIIGFSGENDPRWKAHKESGAKWASAGFRKDINGERVYLLMFGTKYMAVAQQLCDALNSGDAKQIEQAQAACQAIYEQNVADGKAKWEAKKAEWKAKAEERKAQKSEASKTSDEVRYSMTEIAAMFERVKRGEKVPELAKIRELLEKAA